MEFVKRFLIVEDYPIYAEILQRTIRGAFLGAHITDASALCEAKNAITRQDFDIVLLDLRLPDTRGFEGLLELRNLLPDLPILIVSAFTDRDVVHKAILCGASGFAPKTADKDVLLQAIRDVMAGITALPPGYSPPDTGADIEISGLLSGLKSLSHQQWRILHMLRRGLSNKKIADELDIVESTVKAHVSQVLRKMGVASRTQAIIEVSRLDFAQSFFRPGEPGRS